jgi:hypothetical protein
MINRKWGEVKRNKGGRKIMTPSPFVPLPQEERLRVI